MWIARTVTFFLLLAALWMGVWLFVRLSLSPDPVYYPEPRRTLWEYQVIDTMKYSRDLAREKRHDPSFDQTIEIQMKNIADTGATHVAIATPYDEEFFPFLERWVKAARTEGLKVWFRGNFSGWEGWFDYPRITTSEHLKKTSDFILAHPELFLDGDLFTACPECENGGPGDPRLTGKMEEFRRFIQESHTAAQGAFQRLGLKVDTRLYSMNGDVARLSMNAEMSAALGNIITVDHYVKTPERLEQDVRAFGKDGARKVFLGEFGAPIPDIHGDMTDLEQADWLERSLDRLSRIPFLIGLSYWVSVGGSTEIWTNEGDVYPAVAILKKYYRPKLLHGFVTDELNQGVVGARIAVGRFSAVTDSHGHYELRYLAGETTEVLVEAHSYASKSFPLPPNEAIDLMLEPQHRSLPYLFLLFLRQNLGQ